MVKRFLNLFQREITGLHQAAYLLGFFAICSQVLAIIRDRILAAEFGAGETLDLYYSAFRIPDILFVTIASIVSISVLIPFLIEKFARSDEEAKAFIDTVFSFFSLFMVVVGGLAYITAPYFLSLLFPVFTQSNAYPELISLTRVLLLSPIFLGLSNLLASITQIYRRFFIYALSPVMYNIGIIAGITFLYPIFGIVGLGYGVVIGAFLHLAIQIPFVRSRNMMPRFRLPIKWSDIKMIVFISLPRTIAVSSNEIAKLFLISFASYFVSGSIAVFNFSLNLQSVPFSIIGVSYSLAAFPTLTRLFSSGQRTEFMQQMVISTRHIIFWSVPLSVLFIVLRAQIVRTVLGAGNFDWGATRLTAAALALFAFSLLAQNLTALFVRAFYSQGKTKAPLVMNLLSAIVIVFGSYYLVQLFQQSYVFRFFIESILKVSDLPGTVVLMLPLGFSLGIILNLVIHWVAFSREYPGFTKTTLRTLFQISGASVIMGFITYKYLDVLDSVFDINTLSGIFLQGFLSGLIGIIAAIIVLFLLGSKELMEVWNTLHKKIWKAKVIVPDAELK